jgi:hypothetical protein
MSFGASHIADMLSRLRANRELLKLHKHPKKEEEGFIYCGSHLKLKFREGTEEEKKRIMQKIRADVKRQAFIEKSMLILSIVLFIAAFGWFARNFI